MISNFSVLRKAANPFVGLCFGLMCSLLPQPTAAQRAEHIIVVTTDGFRWQDFYFGMDSAIAVQKKYNEGDSAGLFSKFWSGDVNRRRQLLLPFIWSVMARNGQLYGNRKLGNLVNNANPYWFSYPGYSEILTGHVDTAINTNDYPPNPHETVLEFLNRQPGFKGKVAAFGAWEAFDRIINENRSGIPVVSAYDASGGSQPNSRQDLLNQVLKDSYQLWGTIECPDVFTHYAAFETLKSSQPNVLYIAYGETDEWSHAGKYKSYLNAAHQVDAWLRDLWNFVQNHPKYRNKTALFITTDHGRGDINKNQWTDHGQSVADASEIWFAVMGPGVPAKGEMTLKGQWYQRQFAQTMAQLLGLKYEAAHQPAPAIEAVFRK